MQTSTLATPTDTSVVRIVPGRRPSAGAILTGRAGLDWALIVWRNRALLSALVRRDIGSRYRGSALGLAWLVGIPLVMMGTYTFLFVGVLKVRFGASDNPWVGALSIWCGMLFWQALSETMTRSSSVLFDNAPFVKRIPFPLGILAVMPAFTATVGAGASTALFALAYVAVLGFPPATWMLMPVVVAPLALVTLGTSWILAAIGAHLRDLKHVVPLGMTVLMFLTPIVYPASAVPDSYRWVVDLNPLATVFAHIRSVAVDGTTPPVHQVAYLMASGVAYAAFGYGLFRSREAEYADVV